jgi:hypothetical protein
MIFFSSWKNILVFYLKLFPRRGNNKPRRGNNKPRRGNKKPCRGNKKPCRGNSFNAYE